MGREEGPRSWTMATGCCKGFNVIEFIVFSGGKGMGASSKAWALASSFMGVGGAGRERFRSWAMATGYRSRLQLLWGCIELFLGLGVNGIEAYNKARGSGGGRGALCDEGLLLVIDGKRAEGWGYRVTQRQHHMS